MKDHTQLFLSQLSGYTYADSPVSLEMQWRYIQVMHFKKKKKKKKSDLINYISRYKFKLFSR